MKIMKRFLLASIIKKHLSVCKGIAFGSACCGDLKRHKIFNELTKKRYKQLKEL